MKKTASAKKSRRPADPAAKKKSRTAAASAKASGGKREKRPLEVRYREALARVTEPDGRGGTQYRVGYDPQAWAEYMAVLGEWNAPAEREKRDEMAYDEDDAEYIRDAFEGALDGPACWHYKTLDEQAKRRVVGLYDGKAYESALGPSAMACEAKARSEAWADELSAEVLEAASRREFGRRITQGEVVYGNWENGQMVATRRGTPSVRACDVKYYHWEKYVAEAGLVLDEAGEISGERDVYYPPTIYAVRIEAKRRELEEAERRRAEAEEREKREAAERAELEAAAKVGRARIEYESALAAAGVKAEPSVPASVADQSAEPTTAQPAPLMSRLCGKPLPVGKSNCTYIFVRRGKTKRGEVRKGYVFTFGKWRGEFYTESQRTVDFFEDALLAMSKRLTGKAENEGYVKLPDGVTSRNAASKLWQGKATNTMRSFLTFGKGRHKGESRLEVPDSYL